MLDSEKTKLQIRALMVFCVLIWYLSHVLRGRVNPFSAETLGEQWACLTAAFTAGTLAVVAYQKWFWRLKLLRPWFENTPLVFGEYEGNVVRTYKDGVPDDTEVAVDVIITQPSVSKVFFLQTMKNQNAEGHTEACQLFRANDKQYYLEGIYDVTKNENHAETQGSNENYYGAMRLKLDNENRPESLSGSYWSYEFTRGRVELKRKP